MSAHRTFDVASISGSPSPVAAHELAAEQVDTYLTWGEPPAAVAAKVADMQARAAAKGRTPDFGIRLHVIVRETEDEAWRAAAELVQHLDPATIASAQKKFAAMDSVGQRRMAALHGGRYNPANVREGLEVVFFPIYLNTFHGIRGVDPGLIEMARSYGLSGWALYRQVILPGALPQILVGVRFSLGFMWVILIVAETISAQAGVGYMTMNAREFLQTDVVLVGILLYPLLGKAADLAAKGLERWWLRWHPGYQPEVAR